MTAVRDRTFESFEVEPVISTVLEFETGDKVGNYVLERQLSRRGNRSLHLGHHRFSAGSAAIKLAAMPDGEAEAFAHRWVERGRKLIHLRHPNLAGVMEYGVEGRVCYCAYELVRGISLTSAVGEYKLRLQWMPLEDVVDILGQLAGVLDYLHGQDVAHGNLKPNNILLDRLGQAFLVDPLMAREYPGDSMDGDPDAAHEGAGTLEPAGDLSSLGVLLYWMLAGVPPARVMANEARLVPTLASIRPELPSVERVVLKALSPSPDDRFRTGSELVESLRAAASAVSSRGAGAQAPPAPELRRILEALPSPTDGATLLPSGEMPSRNNDPLGRLVLSLGAVSLLGGLCAVALVASLRAFETGTLFGLSRDAAEIAAGDALPALEEGAPQEAFSAVPPSTSVEPAETSAAGGLADPQPPATPNIQISLDHDSVTITNISPLPVSLAGVAFQRIAQDGGVTASFQAEEWNRVAAYRVDRLPAGDCYQLRRLGTVLGWPSACDALQGWLATANRNWYFWIPEEPGDVFRLWREDGPVATCSTGETRCVFYLPP